MFASWDPERGQDPQSRGVAAGLGLLLLLITYSLSAAGVEASRGTASMTGVALALLLWALVSGRPMRIDEHGIRRLAAGWPRSLPWNEIRKVTWDAQARVLEIVAHDQPRPLRMRLGRYDAARRDELCQVVGVHAGSRFERVAPRPPEGSLDAQPLPPGTVLRGERSRFTTVALLLPSLLILAMAPFAQGPAQGLIAVLGVVSLGIVLYMRQGSRLRIVETGLELRRTLQGGAVHVTWVEVAGLYLGPSRTLIILRHDAPLLETGLQLRPSTMARLHATVATHDAGKVFS